MKKSKAISLIIILCAFSLSSCKSKTEKYLEKIEVESDNAVELVIENTNIKEKFQNKQNYESSKLDDTIWTMPSINWYEFKLEHYPESELEKIFFDLYKQLGDKQNETAILLDNLIGDKLLTYEFSKALYEENKNNMPSFVDDDYYDIIINNNYREAIGKSDIDDEIFLEAVRRSFPISDESFVVGDWRSDNPKAVEDLLNGLDPERSSSEIRDLILQWTSNSYQDSLYRDIFNNDLEAILTDSSIDNLIKLQASIYDEQRELIINAIDIESFYRNVLSENFNYSNYTKEMVYDNFITEWCKENYISIESLEAVFFDFNSDGEEELLFFAKRKFDEVTENIVCIIRITDNDFELLADFSFLSNYKSYRKVWVGTDIYDNPAIYFETPNLATETYENGYKYYYTDLISYDVLSLTKDGYLLNENFISKLEVKVQDHSVEFIERYSGYVYTINGEEVDDRLYEKAVLALSSY